MIYRLSHLLPMLALLVTLGCSQERSVQKRVCESPQKKRLRFLFITPAMNEAFFNPVDCVFTGTEDVDVTKQARLVQEALDRGYDGIALSIIDPAAFDQAVQDAAARGVPLVAFNVDDHATPNARLSAVCQNLYQAGQSLGRRVADEISPSSRILVTMHSDGISALEDRRRGIQEALAGRPMNWKTLVTGTDPRVAADRIVKALRDDTDIKAVLCTGQADTEGAGLAVERLGGKGYLVAGFDLSPEILRLVQSGIILVTLDQQPYVQGFYPVVQLTLRCRYGIMPSNMDAGAAPITRENAAAVLRLCKEGFR